jgi:hypothetical protein
MKVVDGFIDDVRLSSKWREMDLVAEAFEPTDEVALGAAAGEPVEVGVAQLLVRAAALEQVIDDDQPDGRHPQTRSCRRRVRQLGWRR